MLVISCYIALCDVDMDALYDRLVITLLEFINLFRTRGKSSDLLITFPPYGVAYALVEYTVVAC